MRRRLINCCVDKKYDPYLVTVFAITHIKNMAKCIEKKAAWLSSICIVHFLSILMNKRVPSRFLEPSTFANL